MEFFRKKKLTDLADVERQRSYEQERFNLAKKAGVEQARREAKFPTKKYGFADSFRDFANSGRNSGGVLGGFYNPYEVKTTVKKKRR